MGNIITKVPSPFHLYRRTSPADNLEDKNKSWLKEDSFYEITDDIIQAKADNKLFTNKVLKEDNSSNVDTVELTYHEFQLVSKILEEISKQDFQAAVSTGERISQCSSKRKRFIVFNYGTCILVDKPIRNHKIVQLHNLRCGKWSFFVI